MYNIGSLKLKNRIFLAPMAEINDIAFRILCKNAGAGLVYTGMMHPLSKEKFNLQDKPAIQIFTCNEKGVKEFVEKYSDKASLFDLNLGCPAKTARKSGFGGFLNLENTEKILKIISENTDKPITIKLRKSKNTNKILNIAEKYCSAICIHPRTIEQGYSGVPDIKFAENLKTKLKIPVIYSGNVDENNAKNLLKTFDFVMIGRRAVGNPSIFSKLSNSKEKFDFNDYLKLAEKYKLEFKQIKFQAMNFTKGMKNSRKIREMLTRCRNLREIKKIM